uniref:Uncharacterized protein n=1 Tax=Cajanus cajan TaxID=3821 RepID=A0A151TDJ8_CAJCA|nr:hypothetical protein KK1_019736 [Cajanus cajan]
MTYFKSVFSISVYYSFHGRPHSNHHLPPLNALAVYDLRSRYRLFLSPLPSKDVDVTNDVAVDHYGNAFVMNSSENFIWKVSVDGSARSSFDL